MGTHTSLYCPHCGHPVAADDTSCPYCGINLGFAAAMAERLVHFPLQPSPAPLSTDSLIPRLGEQLVQAGAITPQQLEEALVYQRAQQQDGHHIRLGQALVTLGFLDRETLDRYIAEIILKLQEALYLTNQRLEQTVKERTQQLQQALQRLSELQRLKANFVSNISHELRTPLTHLLGYMELMIDGALGPLTKEQQRALDIMQQAGQRLQRLIEDLISFATLSRGTITITMSVAPVESLVARLEELITLRARQKNITFHKQVQSGLKVFADGEKIGWALHHLLDNALKFTPSGGQVTLKVWKQGGQVFFSVEDTGIGIPKEHLDTIFESFVQLEDANKRHYGGTGLGLTLVKQILDAHNTTLEVVSQVGKGSRFTFSLPHSGI